MTIEELWTAVRLRDEQINALHGALRRLSNEVLGSLPLMEPLARREFGNTNYNLLIQRANEARALLGRKADLIPGAKEAS